MAFLKEKKFGLQVWVWVVIVGVVLFGLYYVVKKRQSNSTNSTPATDNTEASLDTSGLNGTDIGVPSGDTAVQDWPFEFTGNDFLPPSDTSTLPPDQSVTVNPTSTPEPPPDPGSTSTTSPPAKTKPPIRKIGPPIPASKKKSVIPVVRGNQGTSTGGPVGSSIGLGKKAASRLEKGRAERSKGLVMN